MALQSTTVWEVRTDGDDTNGGGFNSARSVNGVDRSQQAAAHVVIDGETITGTVNATTTRLDLVGHTAANADLGNILQIASGGTAGFYEITGVGSNYWTLDRACGTEGQSIVGRMGGALGSPGKLNAGPVNGNYIWVKSGTYTLTTTTPGASGPVVSPNVHLVYEGYNSIRGDRGSAPVISAGAQTGITLVATTNSFSATKIANFILDGQNGSSNNGLSGFTYRHTFESILCRNFKASTSTFGISGLGQYVRCAAVDCGTGISTSAGRFFRCVVSSCSGNGISVTGATLYPVFVDCISSDNSGDGLNLSSSEWVLIANCVFSGNSGDGIDCGANELTIYNSVFCLNGGYGVNNSSDSVAALSSCADYQNTSGRNRSVLAYDRNPVNLSQNPFVDSGNNDFRLNNTPGGGAELRAAGIGVYGQTDARDIGAVQHADPTQPSAGNVLAGSGAYNDGATTPTLTLPAAADVWHTAAAFGNPASQVTPAMVASDIANCEAGNIKDGVTIDDVTGTYDPVTGNYTDPGVEHVEDGVEYEFAGATLTGTLAGGDPDTIIDTAGGDYVTPATSDVRLGTVYGAGIYEETGTLIAAAAAASGSFDRLLTQIGSVYRNTPGAVDSYGQPAESWAVTTADTPCRIQATGGKEINRGQMVVIADYTIFLGPTVDITEEDRFVAYTVTYEILMVETKRAAGSAHHIECAARAIR